MEPLVSWTAQSGQKDVSDRGRICAVLPWSRDRFNLHWSHVQHNRQEDPLQLNIPLLGESQLSNLSSSCPDDPDGVGLGAVRLIGTAGPRQG